jgi:hypothetical protein
MPVIIENLVKVLKYKIVGTMIQYLDLQNVNIHPKVKERSYQRNKKIHRDPKDKNKKFQKFCLSPWKSEK